MLNPLNRRSDFTLQSKVRGVSAPEVDCFLQLCVEAFCSPHQATVAGRPPSLVACFAGGINGESIHMKKGSLVLICFAAIGLAIQAQDLQSGARVTALNAAANASGQVEEAG